MLVLVVQSLLGTLALKLKFVRLSKDSNNKTKFVASLNGRLAALEVEINGTKAWLTSIYLHANATIREANLKEIENSLGLLHRNSIIGGDFNCVHDPNLDTKNRDGSGSSTYNNPHSPRWEAIVSHLGLTDIYRLRNGALAGGYTRYPLLRYNSSHTHRRTLLHQTPLALAVD
eukprot:scaffold19949_cov120-Isochrysis_galbana.AAC.1